MRFLKFLPQGGSETFQIRRKESQNVPKQVFYKQNHGHLPPNPPNYFGPIAAACWRKIVPYLESTERVQRIDAGMVEQYCTQYEIYRQAYADVQENGIQTKLFTSLQNAAGEIIGKDFTGYRKNPAVGIMTDANKQLNSIGIQLGLTPKGRQDLMQIASHEKKDDTISAMKKFFG